MPEKNHDDQVYPCRRTHHAIPDCVQHGTAVCRRPQIGYCPDDVANQRRRRPSMRRESMSVRRESKPTDPTLIALARRLWFRVELKRTSARVLRVDFGMSAACPVSG